MNPNLESQPRYSAESLIAFASQLLISTGLAPDRSRIVAETLTAADLMGHSTHGLQLLGPYLKELKAGNMRISGVPEVVQDQGSALTWDGQYLPGPWLVHQAIDTCISRMDQHPVMTLVIRRSHHIACLAAFLEKATEKGFMILLSSSDPANRSVAPFGGIEAVYTPNPIAAGIPTTGDPILIDVSSSTTANGLVMRSHKEGKKLAGEWLLDTDGNPTDDPAAFAAEPAATVLPLGGMDLGYKGFALGILLEALTSGLGGFGRMDHPTGWGAAVFLQLLNPAAFGGIEVFSQEMAFLGEKSRATTPIAADQPVRMPGERAIRLRKEQLQNGILLYPTIVPALQKLSEQYVIPFPESVS